MADKTEAVLMLTEETLVGVVRDYLTAVYEAAGTAPPELAEAEVQAALQKALPAAAAEQPTAGVGLLARLKALPVQAVSQLQAIWSDWLRRFQETDEVWPLKLFHATHGQVGEGVRDLGVKGRQLAIEKMTDLEQRFGRVGALTVFGAAVLLTPVPVPGTTLVPVLVAEASTPVALIFWPNETQTDATAAFAGNLTSCRAVNSQPTAAAVRPLHKGLGPLGDT